MKVRGPPGFGVVVHDEDKDIASQGYANEDNPPK